MYIYETYHDPIQMISGDAYADIGAVKPHYLSSIEAGQLAQPKEKPKPRPKRPKVIELEKGIEQYLLTEGVKYIAQMFNIQPTDVRYRARIMGYRNWGSRKYGHWEAPGDMSNKPTVKFDRRKRERFPGANEVIQQYLLTKGIVWIAGEIGMSVQGTRKRVKRLGYKFVGGNPKMGHWEAPKKS